MSGPTAPRPAWLLLVYRLPPQPSSARVSVWRELRRLGALQLQQSCVALPDLGDLATRLEEVGDRIDTLGGERFLFRLGDLAAAEQARLQRSWNDTRAHEYAEIEEECRTKFAKEVEFEVFRDNLTAAEAEELEADLDKVKAWFERVRSRDWFDAQGRARAADGIASSERLLEDFVERVFHRELEEGPSLEPPVDLPWGEVPETGAASQPVPLRRPASRRGSRRGTDRTSA